MMLLLICVVLSVVSQTITYSENDNSIQESYICDDDDAWQKILESKIERLHKTTENIKHKLYSLNLKIDRQFGELKAAVAGKVNQTTKRKANTRETDSNTEGFSHSSEQLIDVRWVGDEKSDIKTTTPNSAQHQQHSYSIPSNCQSHKNGIQLIQIPNIEMDPFYIYCMEDPQHEGASWMLIQRRRNGKTDFYRNWNDYQLGFGNIENEYFIGLHKLHALTQFTRHELWIELEDFSNELRWAKYSEFTIGSESESYALKVLGNYNGTAGDSLEQHVGQKFTTKDVDNDLDEQQNCSQTSTGAWWYKDCAYKWYSVRI